jgi:hypothetical protein
VGFASLNPPYDKSLPSFSFSSAFTGSAARRIALACGKSGVRKMPTFRRSNRSGALWRGLSTMMAVAKRFDDRRLTASPKVLPTGERLQLGRK